MKPFRQLNQLLKKICSFFVYSIFLFLIPKTKPRKVDADIAVVCLASLGDFVTFCTVARDCCKKKQSLVLICREGTGIKEFAELTGYFQKIYPISTKIKNRFSNLRLLSQIYVQQVIVAPAERHILSDIYMLAVSARNHILPDTLQACSLPMLKRIVDRKVETLIPVTAIYELERYEQYLCGTNLLNIPLQIFQFDNIERKKAEHPSYICVFPGAGGGVAKQWPVERFAFVLNEVCKKEEYSVRICGTVKEFDLGERLLHLLNFPAQNLCGKTELSSLKELLQGASLTLANDSGSAHFSIACKTPTVVICGCWEYGRFYPNSRMPQNCRAVLSILEVHSCVSCGLSRPNCVAGCAAPCVKSVQKESVLEEMGHLLKKSQV